MPGEARADFRRRLAAGQAADVVREPDDEEQQDERDPDRGDPLVDGARDRAAPDALDDREQDVSAVERQQWQQVEDREREADQPEDAEERRSPSFTASDDCWTIPTVLETSLRCFWCTRLPNV